MTTSKLERPRRSPARDVKTAPRRRGRPPLVDRDRLLDAAERAIRRHGPTVSLERIAAVAGVTKPVLFAHVGDRRALVDALGDRLLTRMEREVQSVLTPSTRGRDTLEQVLRANLEVIAADRHLYAFVNGDRTLESSLAFARRSAAPLVAAIARRRTRAGLDPAPAEAWGHAIVGMLNMTGLWWLQKPAAERDAKQLAAQLAELVWRGLASDERVTSP